MKILSLLSERLVIKKNAGGNLSNNKKKDLQVIVNYII